jgi:aspartyl/asparaginyl beta-hydroxylase (cupin superfamily)
MKWLMAIPVWSTPRDSLNRFNLVFSRCPYEESPFDPSFFNPSKCCKMHAYARDKILLLVEMHKKKKKLAAGAFCV